MQSHTFTRSRGVPLYMNGSISHQRLYDRLSEPSTSRPLPRSTSLASGSRKGVKKEQKADFRLLSTVLIEGVRYYLEGIEEQKGYPFVSRMSSGYSERGTVSLPPTFVARFHDESAVRKMSYRSVPGTDMRVSKIGFGAAAIGGMFGNVDDSITKVVETALKQGSGRDRKQEHTQEKTIMQALSKIPRKAYYISTKVGRFELDYARTFDFRADKILESLTNSLKRLQITYIDICYVQIHDADFAPNESIVLYETLQALEMAKSSGKIRHIGVTGYPLEKLVQLIECSTARIDFVMTYCKGTLNNNSLGEFTAWFRSKNVAVINSGALSWGLLTEKGPPPWHPANSEIREACLAAATYCSSKNISISKLAVYYAVNFSNIVCCLIGMDSVEQVFENLELASLPKIGDLEERVTDRIMRRYLDRLDNAGWEGVDVAQYWKKLKTLGLTALATHRHSSVESLASTLNGFSLYSSNSSSELRTPRRKPFL